MRTLTEKETIDQIYMVLMDVEEDNKDNFIVICNNDDLSKLVVTKLLQRGFNLTTK